MPTSAAALAQSALGFAVAGDLLGRRELGEMSISELEARVKMNEAHLRMARQLAGSVDLAMAAGVTDHVWDIEESLDLVD